MASHNGPPVGAVIGDFTPPERIGATAHMLEQLGFAEIWIPEDYFYVPGITGVNMALAATERIPVGTGIVSVMVRHPAVAAMEIAAISRAFPGRLRPGFGLGFAPWLHQMGTVPKPSLAAMRECMTSVRRLLAGEEVSLEGRVWKLDRVKLTHPPTERVPLAMGVMGPKMLQLAGELADATIIGATAGLAYFEDAQAQVKEGMARAERSTAMRYACLLVTCVEPDGKAARELLRPVFGYVMAMFGTSVYTDAYGISEELSAMLAHGGPEAVIREMPDRWMEDLAVVGDPDEAAQQIARWLDAGADCVSLYPAPADRADSMFELIAREVLPRFQASRAVGEGEAARSPRSSR